MGEDCVGHPPRGWVEQVRAAAAGGPCHHPRRHHGGGGGLADARDVTRGQPRAHPHRVGRPCQVRVPVVRLHGEVGLSVEAAGEGEGHPVVRHHPAAAWWDRGDRFDHGGHHAAHLRVELLSQSRGQHFPGCGGDDVLRRATPPPRAEHGAPRLVDTVHRRERRWGWG